MTSLREHRRLALWFLAILAVGFLVVLVTSEISHRDRGAPSVATAARGEADIHAAAAGGDVGLVRSLLETNPTLLEQPDDRGRTPLHIAAAAGQEAVVEVLLAKGASVNARDNENPEPLRFSGLNLPPEQAAEAITGMGELRGAQERAVHPWGRETPLFAAARNGHSDVARLLIRKGADVNAKDAFRRTPLHHAAGAGATEVARLLLRGGANANAKGGGGGDTPLHLAAIEGRLDTARLLLSAGAKVTAQDVSGTTPLFMAAWAGHTDLARLLLSSGARVNARMDNQETPLHFAAATGQTEVAQLLLSAGASVGAKSKWGDTPLHVAAQESQARMARLLLARGANPNARNKDAGDTPLHHAARRAGPPPDLAEVLERPAITGARAAALQVYLVLRAAGANPKAKNRLGEAPAEMAPRFEMEYALSRPVRSGP